MRDPLIALIIVLVLFAILGQGRGVPVVYPGSAAGLVLFVLLLGWALGWW